MTPELKDKIASRRVVASVSGGKDSAALSLWLHEQEIEHDRVFADTGWEHPATYEYLRGELTRAIGPIVEVSGLLHEDGNGNDLSCSRECGWGMQLGPEYDGPAARVTRLPDGALWKEVIEPQKRHTSS